MMKIAHKDDYNAMQKRCEGASSRVAGASIRIMTVHFVALYRTSIFIVFGIKNSTYGFF